jgi:hypothetical protein
MICFSQNKLKGDKQLNTEAISEEMAGDLAWQQENETEAQMLKNWHENHLQAKAETES